MAQAVQHCEAPRAVGQPAAEPLQLALRALEACGAVQASEWQEALSAAAERPHHHKGGGGSSSSGGASGRLANEPLADDEMREAALEVDVFCLAAAILQITWAGRAREDVQAAWRTSVGGAAPRGACAGRRVEWRQDSEDGLSRAGSEGDGGAAGSAGGAAGEAAGTVGDLAALAWLLETRRRLGQMLGAEQPAGSAVCDLGAALLAADGLHAPHLVQRAVLGAASAANAPAPALRRLSAALAELPGGPLPKSAADVERMVQRAAAAAAGSPKGQGGKGPAAEPWCEFAARLAGAMEPGQLSARAGPVEAAALALYQPGDLIPRWAALT
jgi:hypothetical protein